jgi:transposase InsO family protein
VSTLLRRHGTRHRYGRVGRKGSIAIIERFWRSLKRAYVIGLFLYHSRAAIEIRLRRSARWYNRERPRQGLRRRTPDEVYRGRPPRTARDVTSGTPGLRFSTGTAF